MSSKQPPTVYNPPLSPLYLGTQLQPSPAKTLIMKFASSPLKLVAVLAAASPAVAGPIAYGICQTGCNAVAVACYAAAGFTFGTVVASAATPAVLVACNAGLGTCSAACATVGLFAPTP